MTDPKIFYRELDALLAKIRIEQAGVHFLRHILTELDQDFGRRLYFGQGRIYELSDRLFTLTYSNGLTSAGAYRAELAMTTAVVQLAYKNRSYIYDQPDLSTGFFSAPPQPVPAQAAFWVHSPERQWLFVFTLFDGWVREEINLFLNSVRTAMNYRLFSDAVGARLERAVQIQKSLLPAEAPEIPGYQIAGRSQPAEMVGGDFFDYYELEEGTFGVGLGDASGHGLPAALLIRDVVIGLRMGLSLEFRTIHTLRRLNKVIQRSTFASNFVSLFIGEFEADGHLFFVNAGHPAPILVHDTDVKELAATGITLGFLEEIQLGRDYVRMPTDSVLVIYSDGIVERVNEKGDMFGVERLRAFILQHQKLEAQALLELLFETVIEFGNGAAWEDDATLVVIKH
jgi:sigma-B regulation protein RsbU (phosphoserine phosphatase)